MTSCKVQRGEVGGVATEGSKMSNVCTGCPGADRPRSCRRLVQIISNCIPTDTARLVLKWLYSHMSASLVCHRASGTRMRSLLKTERSLAPS